MLVDCLTIWFLFMLNGGTISLQIFKNDGMPRIGWFFIVIIVGDELMLQS